MRRWAAGLLSLALIPGVGVLVVGEPVVAAPRRNPTTTADPVSRLDDLPSEFELKRRDIRETALKKVLAGEVTPQRRGASTVVKVGSTQPIGSGNRAAPFSGPTDQYVELSREKSDRIFVVLVEFGNERHPNYPDKDTSPTVAGPTRFDGPLHNQIPEPDRTKDNTTLWRPDFSRQRFQDLYFGTGPGVESLKTYYEKQSSGRFSLDGTITDWVKVRYNEARYGRSDGYPCSGTICGNVYPLIPDALEAWAATQRALGLTDAEIGKRLASHDEWDRYDYDHDGDFNEPDGYIDHFQLVHAGGDQADRDPHQGEDAIWSHRSYVYSSSAGRTGPSYNKRGGAQIGETGLWVGDYTLQPENGGLDVFAHEFGHDLGLPDHYDTSGVSGNAENIVNWWSLMGQNRLSAPGDNAISGRAADLSAWDKMRLGWLDYEIIKAGHDKTIDLGPHEYNSDKAQGAVVVLPPKRISTPLPVPPEGTKQWWSGKGDQLENTLTRQVTLPAERATLTFKASWEIEDCESTACDYAYVEVDGGDGFVPIPGSITKATEGNGIDGDSGGWVDATFDLAAFAGKTIGLRFRYHTDVGVQKRGIFLDDLKITAGSTTIFVDGAESADPGWTVVGFTTVGANMVNNYDNYYIMSNRTWVSYDQYLRTGPYNLGFESERPRWAEHFPYQEGLVISYWDTSITDNNTSQHHGQGLVLPVDAHPDLVYRLDGNPWRPRIQAYDVPFSSRKASSFTLHNQGKASYVRGQAGVSEFDDSRSYYREDVSAGIYYGVKIPKHGVKIKVLSENGTSMRVRVYGEVSGDGR